MRFLTILFVLIASQVVGQIIQENNQNYSLVKNWVDGSSMSDKFVDGTIYIKKEGKYYLLQYEGNLNGEFFGANPKDNLDDSDAIQKAVNYAMMTSQNIFFPSGRYLISKTIKIPQHFSYSMKPVSIDFSNAKLIVEKNITVFESDNFTSKIDSRMTNGLQLGNFEIDFKNKLNNSYAIKIQDFHQGTKLYNISANNVANLIYSINSYYLELYNINSNYDGSAGQRFLFEGYHGLNKFQKLSAVNSKVGYTFRGGMVAALAMESISIEGCDLGIDFQSELHSFTLRDSYVENFKTAFSFKNYIHSATIENTYFNFLNRKDIFLIDYKGLPANNLVLKGNNSYIGTNFNNLIKTKEDLYGKGISIDLNNISATDLINLQRNMGKNIKLNNTN